MSIVNVVTKIARNPLGLIVLFLVCAYTIAGYIFKGSIHNEIRIILVYFLVTFPFFGVIIVYMLVVYHYDKLFAPSDFNDEENFLRLIEKSPKLNQLEELTKKIQQEIYNQPLYRYTKLTEVGKVLTLMLFAEESIDLSTWSENRKFEISDVNNQANQLCEYGWAKLENNSLIISEKGTKEISTFQDICYGRIK